MLGPGSGRSPCPTLPFHQCTHRKRGVDGRLGQVFRHVSRSQGSPQASRRLGLGSSHYPWLFSWDTWSPGGTRWRTTGHSGHACGVSLTHRLLGKTEIKAKHTGICRGE